MTKNIFLLFFALFIFSPNLALAHEEVTIQMTKDGFVPNKIQIKAGTEVTFENLDNEPRWPASDIHPTHLIYPEFDPRESVEPQEKWSFVFSKKGSWRFHDHLFPKFTGVITVKGEDPNLQKTETKSNIFETLSSKLTKTVSNLSFKIKVEKLKIEYKLFPDSANKKLQDLDMIKIASSDDLKLWISVFGPEKIMAELLRDSGGGELVDCHQQAHQAGRTAYEVFGASTFQKKELSCHSGFLHGAMEAFLKEKGTEDLAKNINGICSTFITSFSKFECLHGIGHGVMAYLGYDLPEAIKQCDSLIDDFATSSCYGGVFMENIITGQGSGAGSTHETKWLSNDPLFPCNGVDKNNYTLQYQCYQMQTSWMLNLNNYDFDRVVPICLTAPTAMISVCYKSLGRDIAGQTLRNPKKIAKLCDMVSKDNGYYTECILGAQNVIIDFWGTGLKNQASDLCREISAGYKNNCYTNLATRLSEIFQTKEEKLSICNTFEPSYISACSSL